ncbi:MAG: carboxypeptidase-like regulatory domain-containing protein [Bacteroidetes bacterium]|nr:carboxypeptidase-like regulatory domain-containing protein [Bacteroidota bacterium]MBL6944514.1 carboxypeptidase-like regulatory domain-containing protein [Bacteroidales bacterium]
MKPRILIFLFLLACAVSVVAQKQTVSGVVKDSFLGETVVGANVLVKGTLVGAVTDIEGKFSLQLENGNYTLEVTYVGNIPISRDIVVADKPLSITFNMKTIVLDEISIVGDVARSRETPVAFTTLLPEQIEERLAGQDIPMLLNKTPGVYATEQGGGDGDARITIRGFSQRNVAVMLDGIPVNDMENGWVYWSNWFGLNAVTRSIQVQRGLGASKLALPSVGGTINILTKGIENNRSMSIEQGIDNEGKHTTNLGYTSGQLKNGWSVTMAGAYKQGNGWVDQTNVKAWFFFAKIDKRWGNHITSLTGFGAPQTHTQRSYKRSIAAYDTAYAKEHGVIPEDFPTILNEGIGYNQHWGYLQRDADQWNSDETARVIDPNAKTEVLNEKVNTYFKPQFSIRDSWNVNSRLVISNTVYLSLGTGGGQGTRNSLKNTNLITAADVENNPDKFSANEIGQINWQGIYDQNSGPTNTGFGMAYPINPTYSDHLYYSANYLIQSNNNHRWYGLLSSFTYELTDQIDWSGGIDLRSYKAEHYMEITDLMGGDYAIDKNDKRNDYDANPQLAVVHVGDKVYYYDDGLVNWGGLFTQVEYKVGKVSSFVNLTSSVSGFKKKDYFGNNESEWKYKPGFTFKTGANYNLSEHSNVFINLGYLLKTRDFKYYFKGFTADFLPDSITKNEKVKAMELGYSYTSKKFAANVNAYYTKWENKPTNQVRGKYEDPVTGTEGYTYGDIPGMDALHVGIEIDFIYKILRNLEFQGLISLGNWVWNKKIENLQMYYTDTHMPANIFSFDATGIHVGDAAQTQLGASLRYEPISRLYIEVGGTFFDRYYSDFNPEESTDEYGNPKDSWKIPAYSMFDFQTGYRFRINAFDKLGFAIKLNVLNALNSVYISDARNNDTYIQRPFTSFDARSASVFMGASRRFMASLKITLN